MKPCNRRGQRAPGDVSCIYIYIYLFIYALRVCIYTYGAPYVLCWLIFFICFCVFIYSIYPSIQLPIYQCLRLFLQLYVFFIISVHVCTHIYIYVHAYKCFGKFTYVCVPHVCVYIHIYILYTCVYTEYTYTEQIGVKLRKVRILGNLANF